MKNVETYKEMFEDNNGEFYYVELNAPLDDRIKKIKAIIDYYINLLKEILNLILIFLQKKLPKS